MSVKKLETSPYKMSKVISSSTVELTNVISSSLKVPSPTRAVETSFDVDNRQVSPKSPSPHVAPASIAPKPSPRVEQMLEKTTEGILKAARLGDTRMLSELHREGYSLLSIDETGKTALHYGARYQ
jgi:hypothetical protein